MSATHTYMDLLHSDGSLNQAAFEEILASRVLSEINLRLCVGVNLFSPNRMPLSEVQKWRAEQVKALGLGPISDGERARVVAHERRELNEIVLAMKGGAAKQRTGMNAHLIAAE